MIKQLLDLVSYIIEELIEEKVTIIPYETIKGENYIIEIDSDTTLYIRPNNEHLYLIYHNRHHFYCTSIKEVVNYINNYVL